MNLSKTLLPLLVATAGLGGCVYEEQHTGYREPRRVYHSGYAEREVVHRRPTYYDDDRRYYQQARPVTVYREPSRVHYYGQPQVYGGHAVIHRERGESAEEARRRVIREQQRAAAQRHDHHDHDDDHKKKKKKKKDND